MPPAPLWCGRCGAALGGQATDSAVGGGTHRACERALELEPPRYCRACRRRMIVQVTPDGWTARCVEHGAIDTSTWSAG